MSTPTEYVCLPGYPVPQHISPSFTYQEYAEYLTAYSKHMNLDILFKQEVMSTTYESPAGNPPKLWTIQLADGTIMRSKRLVLCTGRLSQPNLPQFPGLERFTGNQYHSDTLQDHRCLEGRTVLIVGAGMASLQTGQRLSCSPKTNIIYAFRHMPALLPDKAWGMTMFRIAHEFSWVHARLLDLTQVCIAKTSYGWYYTALFPILASWKLGKDNRLPTIDQDVLFVAFLKAGRASVVSGPKAFWEDGFVDMDIYRCDDVLWATGYDKCKPSFIAEQYHADAEWVGWSQHHSIPIAVSVAEAERIVLKISKELKNN